MNEIQIFKNDEFGEVRTILVNGEPYFVGKDVANVLRYSNPQKAIRDHVDEDDRTVNDSFTVNGTQVVLINESGLYSLILSSKLPAAKKFKRWVTSEVLPSIRKTGGYMVSKDDDTPESIMARALMIANETLARNKERIDYLQRQNKRIEADNEQKECEIKKLTPDADYARKTLTAVNTWNTNVVAKEFGMSAITLNKHLQQLGIQYKQHGVWLLSVKYQGKGYTKTQSYNFVNSQGETCSRMQTEWTEAGRRFLHELHDNGKF